MLITENSCTFGLIIGYFHTIRVNHNKKNNILIVLFLFSTTLCNSLPLSTSSRWIIDERTGSRVKLTCANWAAHLEPMLAEGLNKRPVSQIARHVAEMGFNCVRLTWATYMFTRYANVTVKQSLSKLGLEDAIDGIGRNNGEFLGMTLVEAQGAVIDELGKKGVMVVLDNQVSQPMWCCSDDDGNGFFGDKFFDPKEWLQGLRIVANTYKKASSSSMHPKMVNILLHLFLLAFATICHSLPLSTNSRWIVDVRTGERMKLTCANWAGHIEPMLPEGLNKRPVGEIATHMTLMGFNCVRLTYAAHMFTRYAHLTVAQNFDGLGLQDEIKGIAQNNPKILNMTLVEAQRDVIEALGEHGVMVLLDNQVSQPMWCCGNDDGNGFFGDKYFDPKEWLQSLHIVAKRYKDTSMVVGMSLRNELRGPLQNESVWYRYITKGAKTINKANPNVLILVSGLNYDLDFTYLKRRPLKLNFMNKIVYEAHRYSFSEGQGPQWLNNTLTETCDSVIQETRDKISFLTEGQNPAPLIITEFGINQMLMGLADNLFMACYSSWLAENDLDWTMWAFQGSYYLRDGLHGPPETFGMLNSNWTGLRNPEFLQKLQLIQQQIHDPRSMGQPYYIMYHPWSGKCMHVDKHSKLHSSDCLSYSKWTHAGDGHPIKLMGTELCLSVAGVGFPVTLSSDCTSSSTKWGMVSSSKFRLANKDEDGNDLCLDWDPNYSPRILTKKCKCLELDEQCQERPHSQWFKLISANAE